MPDKPSWLRVSKHFELDLDFLAPAHYKAYSYVYLAFSSVSPLNQQMTILGVLYPCPLNPGHDDHLLFPAASGM